MSASKNLRYSSTRIDLYRRTSLQQCAASRAGSTSSKLLLCGKPPSLLPDARNQVQVISLHAVSAAGQQLACRVFVPRSFCFPSVLSDWCVLLSQAICNADNSSCGMSAMWSCNASSRLCCARIAANRVYKQPAQHTHDCCWRWNC